MHTICLPFFMKSIFFPPASCLIRIKLKGHSLGLLTLPYWLSRILLSTICFFGCQMQTLEFIGSRKIRAERTRDERRREHCLGGGSRSEIMSSENNLGLWKRLFFFICVLIGRVWIESPDLQELISPTHFARLLAFTESVSLAVLYFSSAW